MRNSLAFILFAIFAVSISVERKERKELLGGWVVVDPSSLEIRAVAEKCLCLYSDPESQNQMMAVDKVISAKKQVVAGYRYGLIVQVGLYGCTQAEKDAGNECVDDQIGICSFQILVQDWTKTYKLTYSYCGFKTA